jgi:hypothetical protein
MKKYYRKPTLKAMPLNLGSPLLTASNDGGFKATMSGYQQSDDESDGFSQE